MNKIFLIILFLLVLLNPQQAFSVENNVEEPVAMEEIQLEPEENSIPQAVEIEVAVDDKPADKIPYLTPMLQGNIEAEYNFFNNFNKDEKNDKKNEESSLFARIMEKKITNTDPPSFLLKDELLFHPEKGPVSKLQLYGTYNGAITSSWNNGDYDTMYQYNFFQLGAVGKLKGTNTDFRIVVNPRGVHGRNYMQNFIADAYLVNNSIPHHKILLGYSRNQVGREGGAGSYNLPFMMRSQIARNFGSTRALGVRLLGSYDLVDYNLAFNSSDRYFKNWFAGPEFTGWVDFKPLNKTNGKYGSLTLGGGLNTGHNHTTYTVGGLYLGYRYKKFSTSFEYAIADGYNGSYVVDKKATGFYGTVAYKVHPKVEVLARYDQFDPNRDVSGDLKREYSAGVNYFIKGQALRLILNYIFCQNQNTADSHRIMVGTQLLL